VSVTLSGSEGELVSIRIRVAARSLEELLEALSEISFPINPQLRHTSPDTVVEFPAYVGRLGEVRAVLARRGFSDDTIEIHPALDAVV